MKTHKNTPQNLPQWSRYFNALSNVRFSLSTIRAMKLELEPEEVQSLEQMQTQCLDLIERAKKILFT